MCGEKIVRFMDYDDGEMRQYEYGLLEDDCSTILNELLEKHQVAISFLHFGQKRGKFSSTVSNRTFNLVLSLQIGHNNHSSFIKILAHLTAFFQIKHIIVPISAIAPMVI